MFGLKSRDGIKEFEQMRQALKAAERRQEGNGAAHRDGNGAAQRDGNDGNAQAPQPTSNITVQPAVQSAGASATGPASAESCSSIVSTGSAWQGTIAVEESVRIDGRLSGEVEAKGTVLVSQGAEVDAKVRAAYVVIAGTFKGQVLCAERLEILPTGRVTGELATKSLVIHEGAFLHGQVTMPDGESSLNLAQPSRRDSASSAAVRSSPATAEALPPAPGTS